MAPPRLWRVGTAPGRMEDGWPLGDTGGRSQRVGVRSLYQSCRLLTRPCGQEGGQAIVWDTLSRNGPWGRAQKVSTRELPASSQGRKGSEDWELDSWG